VVQIDGIKGPGSKMWGLNEDSYFLWRGQYLHRDGHCLKHLVVAEMFNTCLKHLVVAEMFNTSPR
jgi:hypothetical protein